MTIAVMQPYLFPYLGYFQLVKAVDTFVFFDDVNFINRGWINRNNILVNGAPFLFTVPLKKASQNKLIKEIEISGYNEWKEKFLRLLQFNYKKAPHFEFVYGWLTKILANKNYSFMSQLAMDTVQETAGLLGLRTKFSRSGELNYNTGASMTGEEKILSICGILKASHYINPKNGRELYEKKNFEERNIRLNFISMDDIRYGQLNAQSFVPSLSILDSLMFNGPQGTAELLTHYQLI